jgi:uncharacterized membrane protein YkoI
MASGALKNRSSAVQPDFAICNTAKGAKDMFMRVLAMVLVVSGSIMAPLTVEAKQRDPMIQLAQSSDVAISPGEAADIAQRAVPGSRVLKVKLLPAGVYAVTLKADGRVARVLVDGQSGSLR